MGLWGSRAHHRQFMAPHRITQETGNSPLQTAAPLKLLRQGAIVPVVNHYYDWVGRPEWVEELNLRFPSPLQKGSQGREWLSERAIAYRDYTRHVSNGRA
jgi:hypothetical protein